MGRLCLVVAIVAIPMFGCGVFDEGPGIEWTDQVTGYTWQETPAGNTMQWQEAIDYCKSLTLADHDDWHLPTISELRSLIRDCPNMEAGGSCGVTDSCLSHSSCRDDSCTGCSFGEGSAGGCYWPGGMEGLCSWYYSSSEREDDNSEAWTVFFYTSGVLLGDKDFDIYVRCVR